MNRACRDVTWHKVAVLWIPFFQKVETLRLGNTSRRMLIRGVVWHPHAPAFSTRRFAHQPKFVFAGDRRGVHLDEFTVGVVDALLKERGLRRARAHHGVRRAPEDRSDPARREDDSVSSVGFHFHGAEVHRADAAANASFIDYRGEKRRTFELLDLVFSFVAPHLLVQSVEELLARGCPRESRAVIERAAKAPIVEQAFGRAVEHHAHAVEKIDDARRSLAHALYERLIRQEVAAVN